MADRPNAARQKRHAEAHDRYASPSSKKARFDQRNPSTLAPEAPEEDPILELDEIGRSGQQTKRGAINLDGYESDSSTENFKVRAAARKKDIDKNGASKSKDEDMNDMFADVDEDGAAGSGQDGDEDDELNREGKTKKKDVRFLDDAEIQGQDLSSKSGGHVAVDFGAGAGGKKPDTGNDSSSESSVDDEERARLDPEDEDAIEVGAGGKKRHAPKLDAFNVRQENDEGRFDQDGNFIRRAADPDEKYDEWLVGISKKEQKKALAAQQKRDEEQRRKTAEEDATLTKDLLAMLIPQLHKGETSLEALARLAPKQKKAKPSAWKKKKGDEMDISTENGTEDAAETRRVKAVETISEAVSLLNTRGLGDIYSMVREGLTRLYKRETEEDWVDPPVQYEFRYVSDTQASEPHGPYDGETMRSWISQGQLGAGTEYRTVGDDRWISVDDFDE